MAISKAINAKHASAPGKSVLYFLSLAVLPALAQELPETMLLAGLETVSAEELSGQRGGADLNIEDMILQLSNATATATVENNSLVSQATGNNTLQSGAFDGAAGIVFAVQNSGNHVVIQNTTMINVIMNP